MQREKKIQEAYLKGYNVKDIAHKEHISREAVYQSLRKLPDWQNVLQSTKLSRSQKYFKRYDKYVKDILQLAQNNTSNTQISKILHIPYEVVKKLLANTQFDNSKEYKHKRNKEIYRQFKKGKTQSQLVREFGLAQNTISVILKKWETSQKTSK